MFRGSLLNYLISSYGIMSSSLVASLTMRFSKQKDFEKGKKKKLYSGLYVSLSASFLEFIAYPLFRWRTIVFSSLSPERKGISSFLTTLKSEGFSRQYKGSLFWTSWVFMQCNFTFWQTILFSHYFNIINASTASSIISTLIFYPGLALIRRFQVDSLALNSKHKYQSVPDAFRKITKKENYGGLYRGLSQMVLINAFSIYALCSTNVLLRNSNSFME